MAGSSRILTPPRVARILISLVLISGFLCAYLCVLCVSALNGMFVSHLFAEYGSRRLLQLVDHVAGILELRRPRQRYSEHHVADAVGRILRQVGGLAVAGLPPPGPPPLA